MVQERSTATRGEFSTRRTFNSSLVLLQQDYVRLKPQLRASDQAKRLVGVCGQHEYLESVAESVKEVGTPRQKGWAVSISTRAIAEKKCMFW